ncbi:hypothetical protein ANN_11312 [Periplaneta americana]|uniref:Uncharacterized protein n=1 Tax=Periplaneta americana TaxID=6978 RepID=A0ABQ8T6C1_PERAM|nr:hypothetical protein ANN_11312 [Periplaneta americana]
MADLCEGDNEPADSLKAICKEVTLHTIVRARALNYALITANEIDADMVFNTDQNRFEYELTSNRSLSMTGEKKTEANVKRVSSITHSYTIHVLISMSGRLTKKLYYTGDKFGKRVSETVQCNQSPNIEYDCITTGKMLTARKLSWIRKILEPDLTGASLLLLDS